jgi:hypothetical protein
VLLLNQLFPFSRFSMPASELKVVQSDAGQYVAQLEIDATGYADGKSLDTYGSQVAVNFNGAADPRTATFTITAKMTLNILDHGRNRSLLVTVRDLATGQFGSLIIPMEQVKMPGNAVKDSREHRSHNNLPAD